MRSRPRRGGSAPRRSSRVASTRPSGRSTSGSAIGVATRCASCCCRCRAALARRRCAGPGADSGPGRPVGGGPCTSLTICRADMTSSPGSAPSGEPRLVPLADLRFDRRSPRLSELPSTDSEEDVVERLWREFALEGLATSIALHGFLPTEPLIVEPAGPELLVVDGNRRLAAVRVLAEPALRDRLGVGDLPAAYAAGTDRLQRLPALLGRRDAVWPAVGYRHVSGTQPWRSYARAGYVAWVHEEVGVPLDRVARSVGDGEASVRTLYLAWRALRGAEAGGLFRRDDRWTSHLPFALLVAALDRPVFQEFV